MTLTKEELDVIVQKLERELKEKRQECENSGTHQKPVWYDIGIKMGYLPSKSLVRGICTYCHTDITREVTSEEYQSVNLFRKSLTEDHYTI